MGPHGGQNARSALETAEVVIGDVILNHTDQHISDGKGVTLKFCVKSNECRNRANLYVGGSGLTVCRPYLQHNAGGDGCQGRRSRSFDP